MIFSASRPGCSLSSTWHPLCLVFAVLISACGGQPKLAVETATSLDGTGPRAEPIEVEWADVKGESFQLSSLRGRVVLVSVFATWCLPCAEQLSEFNRMVYGKNPIEGLAVVGVSVDQKPQSKVPQFMDYWRLRLPVILADESAMQGDTPFGPLSSIPTTFVLDSTGRHIETLAGAVPSAYIRRRVQELNGADP